MLNIFGRKYEISEITEIYTGRPPPGSRNQFFNCELLHGCMLVAGCRLLVTKLHAGYRVTARWLPGYWPLVYGSTVGCLLRVTEQQILTCMHAFCIHGPSLHSCGSVALGQPGRLCSSAVHQFRPHSRI